jgi:spore coat protein CotF
MKILMDTLEVMKMSFKDKLNQVTRSREEVLKEQNQKEMERANKFVENQTEAIYNRIEATLMYKANQGQYREKLFSRKKII